MVLSRLTLFLLSIALALGCARGPNLRVDDGLLDDLSPREMEELSEARAARDSALEDEIAAERAVIDARESLGVVRAEFEVARSEHEQSEARVEISRRGGDARAVQSSEDRQAVSTARMEERRRKTILAQRRVELAAASLKYTRCKAHYLDAKVQLLKARTIQGESTPRRLRLERFQAQAEEYEEPLVLARQELESVTVEVAEAEQDWREASARLEALRASPTRAAGARAR